MDLKLKKIKMEIGSLKELILAEVKLLVIGQSDVEAIRNLGIELDNTQDKLYTYLRSGEDVL